MKTLIILAVIIAVADIGLAIFLFWGKKIKKELLRIRLEDIFLEDQKFFLSKLDDKTKILFLRQLKKSSEGRKSLPMYWASMYRQTTEKNNDVLRHELETFFTRLKSDLKEEIINSYFEH
jgi:hypothetical protein